jgi:nucleoside permease NupC
MSGGDRVIEQRKSCLRRDLNALVRGKDGELSGSKIGTYAGQFIAAKLLLAASPLPTWDVLAVLFLVLIAPEAYKQMLAMKWGGNYSQSTVEKSSTVETTSKGKK